MLARSDCRAAAKTVLLPRTAAHAHDGRSCATRVANSWNTRNRRKNPITLGVHGRQACADTCLSVCLSVCLCMSCLVLSCLVLSCLVLSCLVLSCLVLSVLSCLVLSCPVLSCPVLSCLVLSYVMYVCNVCIDADICRLVAVRRCISNLRLAGDVLLLATSLIQLKKMMTDVKRSTEQTGAEDPPRQDENPLKPKIKQTKTSEHRQHHSRDTTTRREGEVSGDTTTFEQQETIERKNTDPKCLVIFCQASTRVDVQVYLLRHKLR